MMMITTTTTAMMMMMMMQNNKHILLKTRTIQSKSLQVTTVPYWPKIVMTKKRNATKSKLQKLARTLLP